MRTWFITVKYFATKICIFQVIPTCKTTSNIAKEDESKRYSVIILVHKLNTGKNVVPLVKLTSFWGAMEVPHIS